jgi:two-component system NtrC family sensor kinase
MRIEHRIFATSAFNVTLIILVGIFAIHVLDVMLAKLRFAEIADDLNASFLEMRISEKNYLLYSQKSALLDIKDKIDSTIKSIDAASDDISRAIGEDNLTSLKTYLARYASIVGQMRSQAPTEEMQTSLRAAGKSLKDFSESISLMERKRVNNIITNSKRALFISFWVIVCSAVLVSHFISRKIVMQLRQIEKCALSISKGNFRKIENSSKYETESILNWRYWIKRFWEHIDYLRHPKDEVESVINAMNFMSGELGHREEQIVQSRKLASMGILTAGVAHELTNPVNNISMITQTYEEAYENLSKEDRIEFIRTIGEEAERIRMIVRNLLDFAKPKEANLKEEDINSVIKKTLALVQNMLDVARINIKMNLEEGLPKLLVDSHQMQQVFVNLITNAVQAMSPGEEISVSSGRSKKGDTVEISITDSGCGICPEVIPHIFDPFFSTKGESGTGLGLSVSYGIIKNHKGDIRVKSNLGAGATFIIELPIPKK